MTQQQIKNSFFICLAILIFMIDVLLFGLLQQHLLLPLHCLIILLMAEQYQNRIILPPLFLLCLLSYLDTNIFGSSLIYMLPTLFLAKYFQELFQHKRMVPYLLLFCSLCIKICIFRWMNIADINWYNVTELIFFNFICLTSSIILHKHFKRFIKFS